MSDTDWRPLHPIDPTRLSAARHQAHYAAQWLARTARAFVAPRPDDEHTNLGWEPTITGFTTHPLTDGSLLGLNITELRLVLFDVSGTDVAASFALNGQPDTAARRWLGEQLAARGFEATALDEPSPYEMPPHPIASGAAYDSASLGDALATLANWFANGQSSLDRIHRQLMTGGLAASPLRCWPHHFDLATLTTLPAKSGGATRYVGTGLSPGDGYYDEPYFYVSLYPAPAATTLPPLPKPGHWHSYDFTAAVTTAHEILACRTPQAETENVLRVAVATALAVLGMSS